MTTRRSVGRRRSGCALALALVALALPACGSDEREDQPPRVEVSDAGYEPEHLTVPVGTRVTFVNREKESSHTAKADPDGTIEVSPQPGPTNHDGSEINRATRRGFATHALFGGEAQKVDFPYPGRYSYQCAFHEEMKGTIEVVEQEEG